jgi:RNA polymerase sigma-70 factor (family 1)
LPRLTGTQDPFFLISFQQGDEVAFDCVFREYFSSLTYYAHHFLSDPKSSEDIVQDCFVLLWQRRDRLQHITAIKSYLYTTVRNQCLKHLQKHKRTLYFPDSPKETTSVEEALVAADTAKQLYQLIATLSPALQQIIRLYYLEGKTNKEIAQQLNIEPDTVIRQRLRAILALRKAKISL